MDAVDLIERKLDEAENAAASSVARYTADEVFSHIKERIKHQREENRSERSGRFSYEIASNVSKNEERPP